MGIPILGYLDNFGTSDARLQSGLRRKIVAARKNWWA
jgi:hypothetical protein